ncbi:MAG TPA: pyroglutamyl-peptidase I [Methyloceanibacter sp.]|nr:pyroglutamyl-peptidase I [Methyloceanibacter sp.]
MARPRVLLTGFGPFPGVPENPSGGLAETLAGRSSAFDCDLHVELLPTEWNAVAALMPRLHADLQPDVMIHFGVSATATGLRIERSAHNRAASRTDACGGLPDARAIAPDGAMRLDTALPVTSLAAHLRGSGHPANASRSCGRYLCNFLYYRSLAWAQMHGSHALFVHVPLTHAQGGAVSQDALLHAGHETLRFVLGAAAAHAAPRPAPARTAHATEARQ